jgi:PAS domain S-box-containing protein
MPLTFPRKSDGCDGFRDAVAFPATDVDTSAGVACAIVQEALTRHFGARGGDLTSLLLAFRRYRRLTDRYLESVLAQVPDAMLATELDGKVIAWNEPARRLFAQEATRVAEGALLSLFTDGGAGGRLGTLLAEARAGAVIKNHETQMRPEGGAPIDVEVTLAPIHDERGGSVTVMSDLQRDRQEAPVVALAVVDTGIGMSEEEIRIAMQPFARIDTPLVRSREGTGLGLPIVQELVQLHGGSVSIRSVPGRGTTVTVRLPLAPEDLGHALV